MGTILVVLAVLASFAVHEYGHYASMRRNGVAVKEVGIGFGPVVWSCETKRGLRFALRPLLVGAYVTPEMKGAGSMKDVSPWQRFKIAFAGPLMNLNMAVLAVVAGAVLLHVFNVAPLVPPKIMDTMGFLTAVVHSIDGAKTIGTVVLAVAQFMFTLNVVLAALNLFPVVPLDGGRCVMSLIEVFFSDDRAKKMNYWYSLITFLLFIELMGIMLLGGRC